MCDLMGEDGGDGGLEPEAHRVVQVYVHHHVTLVRRLPKGDRSEKLTLKLTILVVKLTILVVDDVVIHCYQKLPEVPLLLWASPLSTFVSVSSALR